MNNHGQNLQTVGIAPGDGQPPLVDGVDVAQLLRDIGEASANASSVELFRLCLGAQRVMQEMIANRVPA